MQPTAKYIAKTLLEHLTRGEKVLWLLGGGSGIAVSLAVSKILRENDTDLSRLSVMLTDERYGEIGHADENYRQLLDQGFSLPGAKFYRVLDGKNRATTTRNFAKTLRENLAECDFAIGMFGIGADGHTAGIKPHSPAVTATDFAKGFAGADFERITMTFPAIKKLDEIVIYAIGRDKWPTLSKLIRENIPLPDMPAQILKSVKKTTLFTNFNKKGE